MTEAVCITCGEMKLGSFSKCDECGATPATDDEKAVSLAFTDWFYEDSELAQISQLIKSGETVRLGEKNMEEMLEAVRS